MDDLVPVKPAKSRKPKVQKRKVVKQQDKLPNSPTAIALVAHCIGRSKVGLSIKDLQDSTGFSAKKLYGILFRLKQQGKVESPAYGVYKDLP